MGKSISDAFESYVNWLVLSVFLMAVNLAMEAGAYLVNEGTGEGLRAWAQWPTRASTIAFFVAMVIWGRRLRHQKKQQRRRFFLNEYVTETVKRSSFIAFFLTLVLVAILDGFTNSSQLPADFFIKLPGLSLTAGFSISFFLYNFINAPDSSEEGWTQ